MGVNVKGEKKRRERKTLDLTNWRMVKIENLLLKEIFKCRLNNKKLMLNLKIN
jgi:hypothetical protein